jgi:hypothetical protein
MMSLDQRLTPIPAVLDWKRVLKGRRSQQGSACVHPKVAGAVKAQWEVRQ